MGSGIAMCQVANSLASTGKRRSRHTLYHLAAIIGRVDEDQSSTDLSMMRRALLAARSAAEKGEVPVGAVVAREGEVLAVAANEREATNDPTAYLQLELGA